MNKSKTCLMIFILALLSRLVFIYFTSDDAFITYKYVDNLIAGKGFVYNEGERVLGTTSPLYALILSLFGVVGGDYIFLGKLFCIILSSLGCCILYLILYEEISPEVGLAGGLLSALSQHLVIWSASGLETGFSIFLGLFSILLYKKSKYIYAGILLGLAILTRVDNGILAFVVVLYYIWINRKIPWTFLLSSAIVLIPWLVFSYSYYGTLIPNSVIAKFSVYKGTSEVTSLITKLGVFFGKPDKILFSLLVLLGIIKIKDIKKTITILYAWSGLHLISILISEGYIFEWYYAPIMPGYAALAAVGVVELCRKASSKVRIEEKKLFIFALCFLVLLLSARLYYQNNNYKRYQRTMEEVHKSIGIWLNDTSLENETILASDIGYMGFYSKRKLIDWMGLISPEILKYYKNGNIEDVPRDFKPDYIVLGEYDFLYKKIVDNEFFQNNYILIKTFESNDSVYNIWKITGHG